ncbi:MAG: PD-(D/E)XK nuclease family protein [Bacteroidaceae bacterium]|nr:PD-(D/E)XK nuclease family protein [Bacteroidaceae bacterium]
MDILQQLLMSVKGVLETEKAEKERCERNGDSFNLFTSLNQSTSEIIHSRMIAELLNPKGTHGRGPLFLNKFMSLYNFEFAFDIESVSVSTEFDIGPISKNFTSGGRIDILITDADNNALIIENKIYATDQKNQLLRYANYAKSQKYNYRIVYLSLDCHEPSEFSTGKNPKYDYVLFSYEEDIIPWLDYCMQVCSPEGTLFSSLFQYSQCIKELLNLMNENNKKAIIEIATNEKNINSVLALFNNEHSIKKRIIEDFVDKLCTKAEEMGFETDVDEHFGEYAGFISFSIPSQSDKWALFIGSDKKNAKDVYYGIYLLNDKKTTIKKADLPIIPHLWNVFEQEKNCPCGWSFFWSQSGEKYSGNWFDWYNNETLQAMINGELLNFIIEDIFMPIQEQNVFKILNQY